MIVDNKLIIGSRGSELALWQANFIKNEIIKLHEDLTVEIKIIKTIGDKITDSALSTIGNKGLFTKEIETELLEKKIDLAVHSLKDLQTNLPERIKLAAVTKRYPNEDVLIAKRRNTTLSNLRKHAVVATGSLRRKSQLLHLRPDLRIEDLRGNVPTRIRKFKKSNWDAIILARAGVERLGLKKNISSYISKDELLPAVGQGALGIEINSENKELENLLKPLHDEDTNYKILAERALLRTLEGGCQVPIGANAEIIENNLVLDSFVGSPDGILFLRKKIEGNKTDCEKLGKKLATDLLNAGANRILDDIRTK
jgi:hydroxymethylbilane synthase